MAIHRIDGASNWKISIRSAAREVVFLSTGRSKVLTSLKGAVTRNFYYIFHKGAFFQSFVSWPPTNGSPRKQSQ